MAVLSLCEHSHMHMRSLYSIKKSLNILICSVQGDLWGVSHGRL